MNILVLNCGSSTLKFQIINKDPQALLTDIDRCLVKGEVDRIIIRSMIDRDTLNVIQRQSDV